MRPEYSGGGRSAVNGPGMKRPPTNCKVRHPCNWRSRQYLLEADPHHRTVTGIPMLKGLLIVLLPMALAGCAVGHLKLPMTLGSSDTAKASCPTYADAPAFDCKGSGEVSIPHETK